MKRFYFQFILAASLLAISATAYADHNPKATIKSKPALANRIKKKVVAPTVGKVIYDKVLASNPGELRVLGTGFGNGTNVVSITYGADGTGATGNNVQVISDTELRFTPGTVVEGQAYYYIVTVDGVSSAKSIFTFTGVASFATPTISSFYQYNPNTLRSQQIQVYGTNFGTQIDNIELTYGPTGTEYIGTVTASGDTYLNFNTQVLPPNTVNKVIVKAYGVSSGPSSATFTSAASPPVVTNMPYSGATGSSITITGNYFEASNVNSNAVFFGTARATVTAVTATTITVTVPEGATAKPVTIINATTGLATSTVKSFIPTYSPSTNLIKQDYFGDGVSSAVSDIVALQTGDFNNDGKADLLVLTNSTGYVYLNTTSVVGQLAANNFTLSTSFTFGSGDSKVSDVVIGDFNNDRNLDVAVYYGTFSGASSGTYRVTLALNNISSFSTINLNTYSGYPSDNPGLAAGDINGDGKLDLAITTTSYVAFYQINNGTSLASFGSFGTTDANRIALADLNGDGKLDVITSHKDLGKPIKVILLKDDSSVLSTTTIATTGGVNDLKVEDIDGDGKIDVIFATNTGISVYRNNSTLSTIAFENPVTKTTSGVAKTITFADVDGDGKVDINAGLETGGKLVLIKNNSTSGNISLGASAYVPYSTNTGITTVKAFGIADLDGDAKPDLALPDFLTGNFTMIKQDQSYVATTPTVQATNLSFPSVSDNLVKINWDKGNGRNTALFIKQGNSGNASPVDLTTYNAGDFGSGTQIGATGWYCVYKGNESTTTINGLLASTSYQVMAVSYNGAADGDEKYNITTDPNNPLSFTTIAPLIKITSISPDKGYIGSTVTITGNAFDPIAANNIVYFGAVKAPVITASTTSLTVRVPIGASFKRLTVLNKTSNLLAAAHHPFMVTYPNAKSTVAASNFDTPVGAVVTSNLVPSFVTAGDLDGDGKVDFVTMAYYGSALYSYRNTNNTITNTSFTKTLHTNNAFGTVSGLQLADLDNDGKLDIVIAFDGGISVLTNTTTGTTISFSAPSVYSMTGPINGLAIADLNNDGKLDLSVATPGSTITVLLNNSTPGNRNFSSRTLNTSGPATAIDAKDMDGDGRIDLVVAHRASSRGAVDVLRNNGIGADFSFADYISVVGDESRGNIRTILLEDFNDDGKPDMVLNNGNMQYLVNTSTPGTISFVLSANAANTNASPESAHAVNLNGDGKVDFISTYFYPRDLIFSSLGGLVNTATSTALNFESVSLLSNQAQGIGEAEMADLDGDGRADIIHANGGYTPPSFNNTTGNVYMYRYNAALLPSLPASNLIFSSVGGKNATISWTNGDATKRMVFVKAGNSTSDAPVPVDNTLYTANANFGTGTQIGTTGWYPVYAGSASSTVVSGLSSSTAYQVMVVEYNTNGTTETTYLSTPGTNNPLILTTQEIPTVTSFSPSIGPVGTALTITGTGFNATAANNIVTFGATKGTVTVASATSLTVTVPAGASYEALSVLNTANNLIGYSAKPFVLTVANSTGRILVDDFSTPVTMTTTGVNKRALVTDLDNDGKPDLITTDVANFTIKIFKNNTSGAITGTSLTLLATIATTTAPVKILAKDLDGDGFAEIIYTTGSTVNILQNKLSGTDFNTKLTLTLNAAGNNFAISDINKDGKPDLVVSTASNIVNIFKNQTTTGTFDANSFVAQTQTTLNATQRNVLIGDLDSDGKLDLMVTSNSSTLEIYPGTSTGSIISFGSRITANQGQNSVDMNIADLNDDGKPDLVNTLANSMILMRNTSTATGSFTFTNTSINTLATATTVVDDIQFADFDGDGKVDVAYANTNASANMMGILRNTSLISPLSFSPYTLINLSAISSGFGIGDIDGDGRPDLVAASNTAALQIVRNNPVQPPATPSSALNFTNVTGRGIELNWTSGNGTNRLVFAKQGAAVPNATAINSTAYTAGFFGSGTQLGTTGYYCVYNGTGNSAITGGFTPNTSYSFLILEYAGANPKQLYATTGVTGDVTTGTGAPIIADVSPLNGAIGSSVTITGQFFDASPANNIVFFGATMATVTAASTTSLTVTVPSGATLGKFTVLNTISGLTGYSKNGFNITFTPTKPGNISSDDFEAKVQVGSGASSNTLAVGDIDGDGKSDLVLLDNAATNVVVYRNTAASGAFTNNTFAAPVSFPAGTNGSNLALADLNGDGKLDIGVANGSTFKVSLLKNSSTVGNIAFDAKVEFTAGTETLNSIAFGDVDQDGKVDLFTSSVNNILILRNQGTLQNLSFADPVTLAAINVNSIAVGDLNNDGRPEIVNTSSTDNIKVYQNTSTPNSISFTGPTVLDVGVSGNSIIIADLNGNGKPDLTIGTTSGNVYGVFNNTTDGGPVISANLNSFSMTFTSGADFMAMGDLNGDGFPDGVFRSGTILSLFRNTTGQVKNINHILTPGALAIADLDGDGRNDIIAANTDGTISAYRNKPVFAPVTQASNIVFSNVTFGAAKLTWTNGSGEKRVVFAKLGNTGSPLPTDLTSYTANATFQSGTQIDASGWYCVYNGTGSTVDVTNLLDDADYQFMVVEYNGSAGNEAYQVATGTNNPATLRTAVLTLPTVQASNVTFTNITINSTTINWTNGDGAKHAVFVFLGNTGTPAPSSFNTYIASPIFIGGTQIGSSGWYCVYNGTGNTVNVTNLVNSTSYQVMVVGYNGLQGREKYLTATVATNPAALTTFATPKITAFSPANGTIGTSVTITGTGFGATAANNIVYFGAVKAQLTAASSTSLTVTVPAGATQQPITVLNTTTSLIVLSSTPFVTTFSPTKTPVTAGDFTRIDFPIGGTASAVAVGDLDGDGKSDLVVNNFSTGKILIYRNHSTSGAINISDFDAPVQLAQTTLITSPLKLADIDNDGKLDLIVGNSTAFISVYRNTSANSGAISFATKVDYAINTISTGLVVADLDLDGKQDIGSLGTGSAFVSMLRNTSGSNSISFASLSIASTSLAGTGIGIGDLNGDNKPDLVVSTTSSLAILRNNSSIGSISFPLVAISTGVSGKTPVVTDFNSDGKPDVVMGFLTGTNFSVFQNSYDGVTFSAASFTKNDFPVGTTINALTVGDVDGDGKPDVMTANKTTNNFSALRNTSTATLSFATGNTVPSDLQPTDVLYADLDGDGKGDVITINQGSVNTISIFRYNQLLAPTAAATNIVFSNTKPGSTTLTWTNGNGAKRAVFAYLGNSTTPAPLDLTTYTANIGFGSGTQIGTTGWYCVYNGTGNTTTVENLADLTEYKFMVVEYNGTSGSELYLTTPGQNNPLTLTTSGVVAPTVQASNITTTNLSASGVTLNFTKGDGSLRAVFMLLGNTGTPAPVDLTTYTANATFGAGTQIGATGWYCVYKGFDATANVSGLTQATTYQTMVVEYNGQTGKELYLTSIATLNPISFTTDTPPIVTAFSPKFGLIGSSVTITGTGFNTTPTNNIVYFGGAKATVTAASATELTVTVPAGATYQPLSVTNTNSSLSGYAMQPFRATFYGKASLASTDFTAKVDLAPSTLINTYGTVVGDLNGDGKLDIVVTNLGSKTISIYKNNVVGNNGFVANDFTMQEITTTLSPRYALLQDFDGDGKLDLAVSTAEAFVLVYQNMTIGNGPITFGTPQQLAISNAGGMGMATADLDNDGRADLAVAVSGSTSTATVALFKNTSNFGNISFNAAYNLTGTSSSPYNVALRDLNGDGKPELLVTGSGATSGVVIYKNAAINSSNFIAGMFTPRTTSTNGGVVTVGLAVGDLDDDANSTIDFISGTVAASAIYLHKNTTANLATTFSIVAGVLKTTSIVHSDLALGDLDGDGKPDLVSLSGASAALSILKNATITTGNFVATSFNNAISLSTGANSGIVAIGDLDGDGKPDLITANRNTATAGLSLIRNNPILAPNAPAVNLAFSAITKTTATLSWISGNGTSRLVFMKVGNAGTPTPVDVTLYTANAAFGTGDQIGTSGWYCVYNGSSSTVDVTGLTKNNTYQVMVVESQVLNTYTFYNRTVAANNPKSFSTISDDATLSAITLSNGTLSPTFAAATTNYTASVNRNITNITITPTTTNANATVTVAGTTPATPVNLVAGSNPITILVTAQDGTTTGSYIVDVTRLPNVAPTNIILSNNAIDENVAAASTIGTLSATDADGTLFTYSFATGAGDTNNAAFSIAGNTLTINASPDFETKPSYTIRLLVTDDGGLTFEKTFVITINDLLDNPLISSTGTISAFSSIYGTVSASQSFNVSGTFMATGILVTPPTGFEVSNDNITFTSTVTAGTSGTIASTPVYVRLKANAFGSPSGNIALTSTNATLVNVAIPASTVTPVLPTVTPIASTNITLTAGTFNASVNDGGAATTVTFFIGTDSTAVANGGGSVQTGTGNNLSIVAGTGDITSSFTDVVFSAGTAYFCRVQAVNSVGTVNSTVIKIVALPNSPVLAISGNSGTTISLNWPPITGAARYLVDVATTSDFSTLVPGKSDLSVTTSGITITGLSATTQYYVRAKAVLADSRTGAYSTSASLITQTAPAFIATYNFSSSLTASLTDPTPKPGVDNVTFGNYTLNGATARTLATRFAGQDWGVNTAIDGTKYFEVTITPTAGYRLNLTNLNFDITRASSAAPNKHVVRSSIDNYANNLDGTISPVNPNLTVNGGVFTNASTASTLQVGSNLNLTGFTNLTAPVTFRIYAYGATNGTTTYFALDNVKFTGTTTQITTQITSSETALAAMSTTYGIASTAKTFNVSATDATAGVLVTPPSDFEVSADGETFSATVIIGTSGTIAATPVYVRLKNNLPLGNAYAGDIALTTTGAVTKNVAIAASTVAGGIQTITFAALANKNYGDADFALTATGGASGNAVTYTSSDPLVATITGSNVTVMGAGTATITASQAAGGNYAAATPVARTLTVGQWAQTISFATLANKTFGDANFNLSATGGGSGEAITYTSSDPLVATVSGSTVTIVGVGTTTITASQAGNTNYAAGSADQTLTVGKAAQTITFAALANKTFGDANFSLTATGGASGNAITYTSSDPLVATVSGSTVTIVGVGTTTITASQLGNGNYTAAADATRDLTVGKAAQSITFAALANKTFSDANFSLTATGGASGNAVTYTSSDPLVATVSGSTVTIVGVGTSTITASQLGNANYSAASSVDQTLTIGKAVQTITFNTLTGKNFGDANFSLTATGGASGNSVTYTSSNTAVATVSGSTVTIVGVGTTTITASQLGNASYTAATAVDQTLTVGKAAQTITFATITDKNLNSADFQPGATTTSGLDITYTSSNPTVATVYQDPADGNKWKIKVVGNGTTDITANQAGDSHYNATSLMRTLTVVPVTLPVTLTSYTAKIEGNRTKLVWTTASEQNNDRFEVERSVDGKVFTYMVAVKGNGTTSNSHAYTVYDNNPGNESTYYRLKQYDMNNKVEELGIRSVTFKVESVVTIKAFPNPTADVVNLSFGNYKGQNAKVVITDMLGRTIYTETILLTTGASNYKLNLSSKLIPGQYFINVTGEGLKTVIKLIAF